jgi:hypothetical protein
LESLFLEPLRQARQAGVAVPRLSALCGVLSRIQMRKGTADFADHPNRTSERYAGSE